MLVFTCIIVVFLIVRQLLVPATFGVLGHYRASAVDKARELPINFAGGKACLDCHDDINNEKMQSYHKDLSCEVCHGPSVKHVESQGEVKPEIFRDREHCLVCHAYNPSRPTGFPQVIPAQHNFGKVCMTCHKPHNPTLPHTPEDCSACHREIASKKAVSKHSSLACAECHTVPAEHLVSPRMNQVEKPNTKESCAKCHGLDAKIEQDIKKVNIDTHGGRYLCWDCHYPHYPEVKA